MEFLGVQRHGSCGDTASKEVKDKLLHLALLIAEKEALHLVGVFGFWKQHILTWWCYSSPFARWFKKLLVLRSSQEKALHKSGLCASCSATWATWLSGPSGAWTGSDRRGCCFELVAGPSMWIAEQDFRILKKALTSSAANYSPLERQLLICSWTLVETEWLTVGHQITTLYVSFMNQVLSDPPHHKAECARSTPVMSMWSGLSRPWRHK